MENTAIPARTTFSRPAGTTASADHGLGREALVRYALWVPIPQERLHIVSDHLVCIELRRRFGDGTVAVELEPGLVVLPPAAAVSAPRTHAVR